MNKISQSVTVEDLLTSSLLLSILQIQLKDFFLLNRQEVNIRPYNNYIPSKNLLFGVQ